MNTGRAGRGEGAEQYKYSTCVWHAQENKNLSFYLKFKIETLGSIFTYLVNRFFLRDCLYVDCIIDVY